MYKLTIFIINEDFKSHSGPNKRRNDKKQFKCYGISVLEVLYYHEKQTIQQIGSRILISSGSMTYVIDKLEKRGLLMRNDCQNDRRVIHVTLTDTGKERMNEIMPKHQDLIDYIFDSLTSVEVETITNLLEKVKNRAEV